MLDPPEPPRADPPELDPPDLAPSELDPPVLDPPEPAPPQLAPPEIAPPELDPPEFIPVMPALELDPPELELEPPKLDAPPKLPEDPALASGLKLVSPLELLHAAKASSKEGTIRMEPKGAMDEATFMVILGVRTGEDKSCIHFGVCIRVEWVGFCFADCNACRVRLPADARSCREWTSLVRCHIRPSLANPFNTAMHWPSVRAQAVDDAYSIPWPSGRRTRCRRRWSVPEACRLWPSSSLTRSRRAAIAIAGARADCLAEAATVDAQALIAFLGNALLLRSAWRGCTHVKIGRYASITAHQTAIAVAVLAALISAVLLPTTTEDE